MIARVRSNPHWLILGAILLLATFLRFYKIDAQSLWYDEGNSARIAERSLQLIVEGAAGDIHPPLYYLLLKVWRAVFGDGEAALRSFSAVCGVLTVLFTYLIGRDLFNRRVGLIAAFLLAVMPFAIYYSQEARMYALLALCAAASTFAILDFGFRISDTSESKIGNRKSKKILLYILATTAGLWTQYAYPFVMIAQGVCVVLWAVFVIPSEVRNPYSVEQNETSSASRSKSGLIDVSGILRPVGLRMTIIYILASLIAVALFLPWLLIAVQQITGWGVERQAIALGEGLLDAYRTLVVGRTLPLNEAALPLIAFGALMLIGLVARHESLIARLSLLILAFLPLALLFVFGLYREAYLKFLLVCLTPMCVLVGRGILVIGNWLMGIVQRTAQITNYQLPITNTFSAILTLLLAVTFVPSLNNLYNNPAYARDDYRGIHQLINATARDDDAVLFLAPNQWEVYTYYQRNDRNLFPLTYRPASYDDVARQLSEIAATHPRIFALYFAERDADPEGWYELWMSGNLNKAYEEWIGNIRLAVYDSGVDRDAWQTSPGAMFGEAIELVEARGRFGPAREGDVIPIELTWRTNAPLDKRYKVFVHIGPEDGPPTAQNDSEPAAGYRPTNGWPVNESITDRRGVWIRPGLPGGTYGAYVGMYDAQTGERLPILKEGQPTGDRLKIGEITIAP
jgi:hypothetical protein